MSAPMPTDSARLKSMIAIAARQIIDSADELTALDSAIGDGDHGINMKRGCAEVLSQLEVIAAKPPLSGSLTARTSSPHSIRPSATATTGSI